MTTQHAPYDTQKDASELSTMHTCSLCGDYVMLPCEACSAIYADDLDLDDVLIMLDKLEDITE